MDSIPVADWFIYYPKSDLKVVEKDWLVYLNLYEWLWIEPKKWDWKPVYDLILNLVDWNKKYVEFILDWIARPLQNLVNWLDDYLNRTALMFIWDQWAWKGTLMEILEVIYWSSNCKLLENKELKSWFQKWVWEALMLFADEIIIPKNFENEAVPLLNKYITDKKISVIEKWKDADKKPNYMNSIFFTNKDKPMPFNLKDRRFSMFRTWYILKQEFSNKIHSKLEEYAAAFFYALLNRKITHDVFNPFQTKLRDSLIKGSMGIEIVFAEDILENWVNNLAIDLWYEISEEFIEKWIITTVDLRNIFEIYCKNEWRKLIPSKQLMNEAIQKAIKNAKSDRITIDWRKYSVWEWLYLD